MPAWFMMFCIELVTRGLSSFRGAERCLEIMSEWFPVATPTHVTIRNWVLRMGCHLLVDQPPLEGDWVQIVDHTVEQGQEKALVVLGVTQAALETNGFQLKHDQVQVLAICPQSHPNGEQVQEVLAEIAHRFTPPAYFVSDKGSDLLKGIELYRKEHPETGHIYDVTHSMANLLKKEIAEDPHWQAFIQNVSQTANQTRQTELQFLTPNALRSKSRFLNLGPILTWAEKILGYGELTELTEIGSGYSLNEDEILKLRIYNGLDQLKPLNQLQDQRFDDKRSFTSKLREVLEGESFEQFGELVVIKADKNRHPFDEKFGWVKDYREKVALWSQLYLTARLTMAHVKKKGLGHQTTKQLKTRFSQELVLTSQRAVDFTEIILERLDQEIRLIPKGQAWLATSDIIESIFGKSKIFFHRSPLKTISSLALTIPVFTERLTASLLKNGMEKLNMKALGEFTKKTFGISGLLKRKMAFARLKKVQEQNQPLKVSI